MAGHSHRSSIKNGHKGFKSRHSSKGALKRLYKGKVEKIGGDGNGSSKSNKVLTKLQRKNAARQLRDQKMASTIEMKKLFEGGNGAEKIVTIIPLASDVSAADVFKGLLLSVECQDKEDGWELDQPFVKDVHIKSFKSNLKFIRPDMDNFMNILDSAKVADFVVFGLSGTSEVDPEYGEQIIRALELQGIASYMGVVTNLSAVHAKEKFQLDVKQSLESYFRHFFPSEQRIYNLEKPSDSVNALRTLCQKFPRSVQWRDNRGYMVANEVNFIERDSEFGELMITGTVRGIGFHANRLVHIPDTGDFQISRIERISCSMRRKKGINDGLSALDDELHNSFESTEDRETLEEFAPNDAEMEQLSQEEFEYENLEAARYDDHGFLPGREQHTNRVKVPKGTSEYQAKWYLDDAVPMDDENEEYQTIGEDFDEGDDEDMDIDLQDAEEETMEDNERVTTEPMFVDLSAEEEARQLSEYRALEKEDREFPDEIELDPTESAIERLRRYRGLKNLHNCNWEVDEKDPQAPPEWNRLLRISNYRNTRAKILKEAKNDAQVIAGDRIKLYLKFPTRLRGAIGSPRHSVLAIYGLLPHEHKNAMVNLSIQRWEEYDKPVPSEEPLLVQCGIRRYKIQPLFSSASNSPNNVHKFESFLQPDTLSIATFFAPVDFTQSPAIYFKISPADPKGIELVGHGSFLNVDHTRILAKRVILTGHPFRFHKSVVTVRYMFFHPQDIEWFKSIPLFTKSGRTGFIKESLGTHGYYKATFDGRLSAQDVVAMSLYKRKWPRIAEPSWKF
ncbi:hypothetical protein HG537_0E01660 [Torulaspora globosa]|uniref:Bms1-type G domain-containing protein n=1 Tax=Torulaspora globosa TaxID=48254 RepID=A0A7H9HTZ4_9SACH|nr:hypothetical protein HG537_0E01660 [Torulaspora sp. CBS 2947]